MWTANIETLSEKTLQYKLAHHGQVASFRQVVSAWQQDEVFVAFFIELLANSPFPAFFWEVLPITNKQWDQDFEFVLVNSSSLLGLSPKPQSFEAYFDPNEWVVSFPNLGGDAQLIVPVQRSQATHYTHLAVFIRQAPKAQLMAFWQSIGQVYESLIGDRPKWLSTAGLGVHWLHMRVDSRPKYYRHQAYRIASSS